MLVCTDTENKTVLLLMESEIEYNYKLTQKIAVQLAHYVRQGNHRKFFLPLVRTCDR